MKKSAKRIIAVAVGTSVLALAAFMTSQSPAVAATYASMAPIGQYLMDPAAEAALARSAAPQSLSGGAAILVLEQSGYKTVAKGHNGFVCMVERSWGADFNDPGFWNPKIRSPICFNAAAARSVLPEYVQRTQWVLAGASKDEMLERTRKAVVAKEIVAPEVGSMSYMMAKNGYVADGVGHWHPHLMFFLPHLDRASWGVGLSKSPVFGGPLMVEPTSIFFVPLPAWSDGSPASADTH